jgi:hypothetical protein
MSSDNSIRFIQDQRPLGAIIGGAAAIPVASITWALVISIYKLDINIIAIAVGFIVGYSVRIFGRGVTPFYGVIGAVFTIAGCISGRLLSILVLTSIYSKIPLTGQIMALNKDTAFYLLQSTFEMIDLIFYLIAIFVGYYSSFRK